MATVIVVNPTDTEPLIRLRGELKSPRRALERIGAILVAGSQQAFDDQKFGTHEWPPRYPNQTEPFINVAGAIADFEGGRDQPKMRRFDRRPALRDRSLLMNSIASSVISDDTVTVGTVVPYAGAHQWGLTTTQKVTTEGKQRVAKWLLTKSGWPYRAKLLPVLQKNRTSWDTDIVKRPFLGVTKQMEDDIAEQVAELIAEAASGGGS